MRASLVLFNMCAFQSLEVNAQLASISLKLYLIWCITLIFWSFFILLNPKEPVCSWDVKQKGSHTLFIKPV